MFVSPDAGTSGEEPSESVAEPVAAAACPVTASPSAPSAPSAPHHPMENHTGNLSPPPHLHFIYLLLTAAPGTPAPPYSLTAPLGATQRPTPATPHSGSFVRELNKLPHVWKHFSQRLFLSFSHRPTSEPPLPLVATTQTPTPTLAFCSSSPTLPDTSSHLWKAPCISCSSLTDCESHLS